MNFFCSLDKILANIKELPHVMNFDEMNNLVLKFEQLHESCHNFVYNKHGSHSPEL